MRLFTALQLPDDLKRRLASVGAKLLAVTSDATGPSVTYTREENLHVTLNFFGEVPEATLTKLSDVLGPVSIGGPIPLVVEGIEFFPQRGPIRIVAARVGGDSGRVVRLHEQINHACADLGFPSETRPYRPHVTLARSRHCLPAHLRGSRNTEGYPDDVIQQLVKDAAFEPSHFTLFKSDLKPAGPEYTALARFPLTRGQTQEDVSGA